MKELFTSCMILGCLTLSSAQSVQGHTKLSGSVSLAITGHSVTLTWNASKNATGYNVYRGTTHGGPYIKVGSGIASTTYNDAQVTPNQTLYYVTTALSGSSESGYSNEATAVIP
jgi:fibronectin type 3 domain-containing protein